MTRHEKAIRAERVPQLADEFGREVIAGLSAVHKRLPCRFFYDARGSQLFEQITQLEEYYPTRAETLILREHAAELARHAGRGVALVEFGSGSSRKTELLLSALQAPRAYVPIDVSASSLAEATERLRQRMPGLPVIPIEGDFSGRFALPEAVADCPRLGFFPGSTIGNFDEEAAILLLKNFAEVLGARARFVVGVDLEKDAQRLIAAYNDAQGVTAEFNLNLLVRINRELGGNFDVSEFKHVAIYEQDYRRIEMHLISRRAQTVHVLGHEFSFAAGESIHTENSCKYSVERFREIASASGWTCADVWLDPRRDFSVHELVATGVD